MQIEESVLDYKIHLICNRLLEAHSWFWYDSSQCYELRQFGISWFNEKIYWKIFMFIANEYRYFNLLILSVGDCFDFSGNVSKKWKLGIIFKIHFPPKPFSLSLLAGHKLTACGKTVPGVDKRISDVFLLFKASTERRWCTENGGFPLTNFLLICQYWLQRFKRWSPLQNIIKLG